MVTVPHRCGTAPQRDSALPGPQPAGVGGSLRQSLPTICTQTQARTHTCVCPCPCPCAGTRLGVPTAHSILLCALCGPLGWLCHFITRQLSRAVPALKAKSAAVVMSDGRGGTITILPYVDRDW